VIVLAISSSSHVIGLPGPHAGGGLPDLTVVARMCREEKRLEEGVPDLDDIMHALVVKLGKQRAA